MLKSIGNFHKEFKGKKKQTPYAYMGLIRKSNKDLRIHEGGGGSVPDQQRITAYWTPYFLIFS